MGKKRYEIGGLTVEMTEAQAQRWNAAKTTKNDYRTIMVSIPEPVNSSREITLRRACCEKLKPSIANQIVGMPANWIR